MITSVQIAFEAVISSLRKPQVWALAFPGGIVFMEAALAGKLTIPLAADRLAGKLGVVLTAALALLIIAAAWTALSWVWITFDRYFFSNPGWISNPARGLSVMTMAVVYLFGWGFLTWIVLLAVAPRIGGPETFDAGLLLPLTAMPRAYAIIVVGMVALFMPLALRVGLSCVLGACEQKEPPTAQLKRLFKTTRRKGASLLLPLVIFSPLIAVLLWSARAALTSGSVVTALPMVLIFSLALLPIAAAQVSLSRHFFGVSKFGEEFQTHDIVVQGPAYSDTPEGKMPKDVKAAGLKGDEATLSEETLSIAKYNEGAPPEDAVEETPPPPPPAARPAVAADVPPADVPPPQAAPPPAAIPKFDEQAAPPPAASTPPPAAIPKFDEQSPTPPPAAAAPQPAAIPKFDEQSPAPPPAAIPKFDEQSPTPPPAAPTPPPAAPTPPPAAPTPPPVTQHSTDPKRDLEPSEGDLKGSGDDPSWADGLWDE